MSLFQDCASKCDAYASCGGYRTTAPCGCIWKDQDKRNQCSACSYICLQREVRGPEGEIENFASILESGLPLAQVKLLQRTQYLPKFIPTYTHKCAGIPRFSEYVAVDIRSLIKPRKKKPAAIGSKFTNETAVRKFLNVNDDCKMIAVLNGPDWMLESFWAMNRFEFLKKLKTLGFSICTGPTFSVTKFTETGEQIPQSHHTIMLERHHRIISEIDFLEMEAVPNLYWIDGDSRETSRWIDWLKANKDIYMVSKDFTSTKQWSSVQLKIKELLRLLDSTGRKYHIIVNGTGGRNAPRVFSQLSAAGHTVSIITSAPILKAVRGGAKYESINGVLVDSQVNSRNETTEALITHNLGLFEASLTTQQRGLKKAS